ncbi:MAG: hypothetical protein J6C57_02060, partial [Paludibacteraceae bacterium]|nr:hypothetical protein [Paludibacteraceae bacterium]
MKRLINIGLLLCCISLSTWAQDVMDISLLHTIVNDTSRIDSTSVVSSMTADTASVLLPDTVTMTVDKQDTVIVIRGLLDSLNAPA